MAAPRVLHVPVLRGGVEYDSLEREVLLGHRDGAPVASVSRANAGIVRRDLRARAARAAALRALPCERRLEICSSAGEHFLHAALPVAAGEPEQSPQDFVAVLSASTGLPHRLCRANMQKIGAMLAQMPAVLRGLTRGLALAAIDEGLAESGGLALSYARSADALGVVLPSNSPGVNSLWLPAIALGVPVVLKPGRRDPWTPLRIARAFAAAGCPPEAFSLYPTDHEGAAAILEGCERSLLFGDAATTAAWAGDPRVEIHGPGRSKLLIGADESERWEEHLELMLASVLDNGGRSCVNASTVLVPRFGDEIADALARGLAAVLPRPAEDEAAELAAFAEPAVARGIDALVERGLAAGGAEDVSARHRSGPRLCELAGATYLLPTIARCESLEHPLARTELLFPFASVVEVPPPELASALGPSLVVTALTRDPALRAALLAAPDVQRLNLGPVPTTRVDWDQPHEGNLFELLFRRRAIHRAEGW